MNYFELYATPLNLIIDATQLKKTYYQLSKVHHPDQVSLANADAQAYAMQMSTLVNKGYTVLSNTAARLEYVLQLLAIISPEENYKLAPDFLMQMMELNEQIMDAKLDDNAAQLQSCATQMQDLESQIQQQIHWVYTMQSISTLDDTQKESLKKYYYQIKYIKRVKDLLADKQVEL
jgi:molecular chaperone HscB